MARQEQKDGFQGERARLRGPNVDKQSSRNEGQRPKTIYGPCHSQLHPASLQNK